MLKIGLIGGGEHSRSNHLPALKHLAVKRPDQIELAAFCDLNPEVAETVAAEYGFRAAYSDVGKMLATANLDGCIAITPPAATASVTKQIIESGVPVVIKKPPGRDAREAKEICDWVHAAKSCAMVSLNRRFDPALVSARRWILGRRVEFIRATMLRVNRQEPDFYFETGLHAVDAMRRFAGEIATIH